MVAATDQLLRRQGAVPLFAAGAEEATGTAGLAATAGRAAGAATGRETGCSSGMYRSVLEAS
jgi:hypothetical protein